MKALERDKEGRYIMIKGTIQQENITLLNIYVPNIGVPNYVNQILVDIKGEINRNTGIAGDFNTSLTSMDRSSQQNINKETVAVQDTLGQMDLLNIFRTFHPKAAECTYFSSANGMFSRIDYILGHKVSINLRRLKSYQASSLTTML